jgi:cation transporter-like permease
LLGLRALRKLYLGSSRLTDQGLLRLATLPELRTLTLTGSFTGETLERVKKEHQWLRLLVSVPAKKE